MTQFEQFLHQAVARALGSEPTEVPLEFPLDRKDWNALALGAFVTQVEAACSVEISVEQVETLGGATSIRDVIERTRSTLANTVQQTHTIRHIRRRCTQLFLIYRGRYGALPENPASFVRQTRIHERNYILFTDERRADYSQGISLDLPTFAEFVEWQKVQRDRHFGHVTQAYCLGISSGAVAAVLSAYFLEVSIVWLFGLPTTDLRRNGASYLNGMSSAREVVDLRELLVNDNGATEYRLYYSERFEQDRRVAERLRHCPGVKLFPQSGDDHYVIRSMSQRGALNDVLVPYEGA